MVVSVSCYCVTNKSQNLVALQGDHLLFLMNLLVIAVLDDESAVVRSGGCWILECAFG